jgi:hypothetical protein
MAAVAQLKAVLGMDSKDFKAGMSKASKDVSGFQSQIKKVGGVMAAAFSVGVIVAAGKSLATWAGNVSDAANNAGLLTSEMLALQQASIYGGLGLDGMSKLLTKVQVKLAEATSGNKEARKSFTGLGLDIEALNGLNPAQLLEEVARAAIASGSPLTALADIFGEKLGPKSVQALRGITGNEGLPKISEEAGKAADKLDDLSDKWETLVEKVKRWATTKIGIALDFYEEKVERYKAEKAQRKIEEDAAGIGKNLGSGSIYSRFVKVRLSKEAEARIKAAGDKAIKDRNDKLAAEEKQRLIDEEVEKNRRMETARETEKRLREEERIKSSNALKEQDKKDRAELEKKWAKNKSISENKAAQEKVKKEYLEQKEELAVKEDKLLNPISKASPISPDSMARVGGFFGNERAGMDVYTKSLEVQREQLKIMKEDSKNAAARDERIAELVEKLEFLQGVK